MDIEKEIQNQKMNADYRIIDCGSTKKKHLFVCENATHTFKWLSEKEEKELISQGKEFATDF